MLSACREIVLCGLCLTSGFGQRIIQPSASRVEALERFAQRTTAQVIWSKEVGRIDSDRGHAVITALIVEDATRTPSQMRGIRIDLTDGDVQDQVYTSEDLLHRLIMALDEITSELPRFQSEGHTRGCFGSGIFWQQPGHAFNASACTFPDWAGLAVGTGTAKFQFTGIHPALFAGAIARARDELKKQ
jgi:hypothetical protein